MVANTLAEVLSGKGVASFSLDTRGVSKTVFDYSLLAKYDIPAKLLPPDTEYLNQPTSFINRYSQILPIVVLIILALLLFILSSKIYTHLIKLVNEELKSSRDKLTESQAELKYQAEYDEILDIMNRRTAMDYMRENIMPNQVYSIVMIDIDSFADYFAAQIFIAMTVTVSKSQIAYCSILRRYSRASEKTTTGS